MSKNNKDGDKEDLSEKIRKAALENKITFASDKEINEYPDLLDKLLHVVLKCPEAFVTNQSRIAHFTIDEDVAKKEIERVFGIDVSGVEEIINLDFQELLVLINKNPCEHGNVRFKSR